LNEGGQSNTIQASAKILVCIALPAEKHLEQLLMDPHDLLEVSVHTHGQRWRAGILGEDLTRPLGNEESNNGKN